MIENQDNPRQPFIARVDRFFEDTKKETDQKRVLVDWYLRLEDTSQIRNRDFMMMSVIMMFQKDSRLQAFI